MGHLSDLEMNDRLLYSNKNQFIIFSAIGFVRDGNAWVLNISWLTMGLSLFLFEVEHGEDDESSDE